MNFTGNLQSITQWIRTKRAERESRDEMVVEVPQSALNAVDPNTLAVEKVDYVAFYSK